jgi:hypothetical protein
VNFKERIVRIVQEEFPGSKVLFHEGAHKMTRFRIEDGSGRMLSRAFSYYHPFEIDDRTDESLRRLLRKICGSPH